MSVFQDRDRDQLALLKTGPGQPGSGFVRYAAAMHFYRRGLFSAELLEIYRRLARQDSADPVEVARLEGIEHPEIP